LESWSEWKGRKKANHGIDGRNGRNGEKQTINTGEE
jgi:hypothetical protein